MVRSCAPPEVVSDALRAKFDEMARREREEKKIAAKKGGAKVSPESADEAVSEGGTGLEQPAAGSATDRDSALRRGDECVVCLDEAKAMACP